MSGWYYSKDESRFGPLEIDAIKDMIKRQVLDGSEYIWNEEFGSEWKPLANTEVWRQMGHTPPLPIEAINDTFIWFLAIVPLFVNGIDAMVYKLLTSNDVPVTSDSRWWYATLVVIAINSLLAQVDTTMVRKTGNLAPSIGWAIFLVPVYIWKRSSLLNTNQAPFIVWIAAFIASVTILA